MKDANTWLHQYAKRLLTARSLYRFSYFILVVAGILFLKGLSGLYACFILAVFAS